jgi:hypothetical protein
MRLTQRQQLAVVLGAWLIAAVASGAEVTAATSPATLIAVVVVACLIALTSSQ